MATYRKKKIPEFKDGGRIPTDDIAAPPLEPVEIEVPEITATRRVMPEPERNDDDAIKQALEGTLRADALRRAPPPAPPKTVDEAIDQLPLSDFWKQNLRAHPALLDASSQVSIAFYQQRALKRGIDRESPAMLDAILYGLRSEAGMAQRAEELTAPPDPERAIRDALPIPPRPALPAMPAPAPRRSMPVSAPVSREVPTASGGRASMSNKTLSAAEVEIAHKSFTAPDMTNTEKEWLYLQNREKLFRMRASGEYRKTSEENG